MKTRVISSLVGLAILAVVAVFFDTLLLNVVIGIINLLAVFELLNATGVIKHRVLTALAILLSLVIPFARAGYVRSMMMETVFIIILLFFITMLRGHESMRIEHLAMAFFFSTFVPVFFSCAVYLREDFGPASGGFYLLLALGSAWLCDTGAYFVGLRFGKHKLAPKISPKKTIEGAVGGLVTSTVLMLVLAWVYSLVLGQLGSPMIMRYGLIACVTPVCSVIGMLGDLSASAIKRNFGVKDFGHIMPGHGGILDRFDSVLFTLPTVYILARHIGLVVPLTI